MKSLCRMAILAAIVLGLAGPASAQTGKKDAGPAPPDSASLVKAMVNAMEPGEGQKKLEGWVGTFDVKILTWLDPSKPPSESPGVAVCQWVLGGRYIQIMLSAFVMGEPFNAIAYAGYDNVSKKYVTTYMDSGSTGMEWYTGTIALDGKSAKMAATIHDEITGKPTKVEMRIVFTPDGNHHTELWQADKSGKMQKVMDVQYTRKKS